MAEPNNVQGAEDAIRQLADVVVAHDAVHPDRNVCGGVGACAIMRAEHDAEVDVIDYLASVARSGRSLRLTSSVKPKLKP